MNERSDRLLELEYRISEFWKFLSMQSILQIDDFIQAICNDVDKAVKDGDADKITLCLSFLEELTELQAVKKNALKPFN